MLQDFEENLKYFVKVFPRDYKKVLEKQGVEFLELIKFEWV